MHGVVYAVRCGVRSCPSCGKLWLGDTRVKMLAAARELRAAVALVTVTAPGADLLPWAGDERVVAKWPADEWNRTAPARWSALHRRAARRARRVAEEHDVRWALLWKAWELQRRGVLHLHLVVPCGSPGERAASEAYVAELALEAGWHRFGFVDRGKLEHGAARTSCRRLEPVEPHRAAAYLAAYVSGSGAGKEGIMEVARRRSIPGAVVYVSCGLLRRSGVTMRSLRDRRRIVARYHVDGSCDNAWRAACLVDAIERSGPPLSAGDRGALLAVAAAMRWSRAVDTETGQTWEPTKAPPPARSLGGLAGSHAGRTEGVVRLDFVLHRGHVEPLCRPRRNLTCHLTRRRRSDQEEDTATTA